jgi:hypothetical protein
MPQGEDLEKCPFCPHCGKKAWIVDGTGDFEGSDNKFWLLCILHDDPITTAPLPEHLEIEDGN